MFSRIILISLTFFGLITSTKAHDHHNGASDPNGELDALILIHIFVQFLVWCILFPIGLIFGFVRARLHVPIQATSFVLTIGGYILGHKHAGRTFPPSLHALLASIIIYPICIQILLGSYLKLHINEGTKFRHWMVIGHRIVGLCYPALGWTQALFGILVLGNVCSLQDDKITPDVLKCAEPFLTGTVLMQYGVYSFILTLAVPRLRGQSPETWDSILLCLAGVFCGLFNFWRLGAIWIGLIWSVGGIVSFLLSRNGRRTILPSVLIILTGLVKIFTPSSGMNTTVKSVFGVLLALAGAKRLLDIYSASKKNGNSKFDSTSTSLWSGTQDGSAWRSFVPILFMSAGMVYMTSSEELVKSLGFGTIYAPSYLVFMLGLSMAAAAFLLFLGHLYRTSGRNAQGAQGHHNGSEYVYTHVNAQLSRGREDGQVEHTKVFAIEDSDEEEEAVLRGNSGNGRDEAYELEGQRPARAFDSDEENTNTR